MIIKINKLTFISEILRVKKNIILDVRYIDWPIFKNGMRFKIFEFTHFGNFNIPSDMFHFALKYTVAEFNPI